MRKHAFYRFAHFFFALVLMMLCFQLNVFAVSDTDDSNDKKPFIVYIQGMDTRGDQIVADKGNADVNILAFVNPEDHKVLLLSTPRDYYYYLRGNTDYPDKLTHCGYYGIDCGIDTLNSLYDIDIDYYVKVGFNSVKNIVDILDGITVDSEWDFKAGGNTYHVGENNLDGPQALAFCRERYTLPGGDRARGKNQQRVILGIIDKLTSSDMVSKIPELVNTLLPNVETDFPTLKILSLAKDQLEDNAPWDVKCIQADGPGGWDYCTSLRSANDVVYIDWDTVNAAKANIKAVMNGEELSIAYNDSSVTKKVQEALNSAGFDCGTPDGIAGPRTYAALNAYQEANGLPVENTISDKLLEAMGIE